MWPMLPMWAGRAVPHPYHSDPGSAALRRSPPDYRGPVHRATGCWVAEGFDRQYRSGGTCAQSSIDKRAARGGVAGPVPFKSACREYGTQALADPGMKCRLRSSAEKPQPPSRVMAMHGGCSRSEGAARLWSNDPRNVGRTQLRAVAPQRRARSQYPLLVIFGPENNLIPMLFKLPLSVA